jgi:hypothetical protein
MTTVCVVQPGLGACKRRQLNQSTGEFIHDKCSLLVHAKAVVDLETGKKRKGLKLSEGDLLQLVPTAEIIPDKRVILWDVNPLLKNVAVGLTHTTVQYPDDVGPGVINLKVLKNIDLKDLDYLYRGLVIDQVIRAN